MAKRLSAQPQLRKSIYIYGGVALAVALLGLVLMTFVGGGGGGTNSAAPAASPSVTGPNVPSTGMAGRPVVEAAPLRDGGRNPFQALVAAAPSGGAAPEPTPAPEAPPAEPTEQAVLLEAVSIDNGVASIRVDSNLHEGVKAGAQLSNGFVLEAIQGECAFIARSPERFRVCEGERFLK